MDNTHEELIGEARFATRREYWEANAGEGRQKRKRHKKRKGAKPGSKLETLGKRDKWICHLCGKPVDPKATGKRAPSRDHIVPRSQGGPHKLANLALAHRNCNHKRGSISVEAYRENAIMGTR